MKNLMIMTVGLSIAFAFVAISAQSQAKSKGAVLSGISPAEIIQIATAVDQSKDVKDKRIMEIRVVPGQKVEVKTGMGRWMEKAT